MRSKAFKIFNYILFAILAVVMVYPFWYCLLASVMPYDKIMNAAFPLIPTAFDFSGYEEIIKERILIDAYYTTIAATLTGLVFSMMFTIAGAYVLSIGNLPGRRVISVIILITMFFSGGVIPTYILLSDLNLINNFWVYIFPSLINTVYMFIVRSSFCEIPQSLREAAEMDGCNYLQIMFVIYVRLSIPTLAVIALFYAVDKWNELYTALYYITDYKKFTLQAALYNLLSVSGGGGTGGSTVNTVDEQTKYAAVIMTILPIIVVYPFLQKYFKKGVLLGSVKE